MLIADVFSRLIAQCEEFLTQKQKLVPAGQFFCKTPPEHAPHYIVVWIMNELVHFYLLKHVLIA
jgi:hypothetical protein